MMIYEKYQSKVYGMKSLEIIKRDTKIYLSVDIESISAVKINEGFVFSFEAGLLDANQMKFNYNLRTEKCISL